MCNSLGAMNLGEYREQVGRIPYGKRLPGAVYVLRVAGVGFGERLDSVLKRVEGELEISPEFNVVKFRTDELKVSFLAYPDFFTEAHPALERAVTVDLATGEVRRTDYTDNINPPILHRKEQMLPADHPRRAEFAALTEAEEAEGLYADTRTIGFRLNWARLLSNKGLSIERHTLSRIEGDWLEAPADGAGDDLEVVVDRHKTALRRYELSKPVKCLMQYGLLKPGKLSFDYGCGLGTDMAGLRSLGYAVGGWDPKFRPDGEKTAAEVVNLGYVLNVIEDPVEKLEALCGPWELTREVRARLSRTRGSVRARAWASILDIAALGLELAADEVDFVGGEDTGSQAGYDAREALGVNDPDRAQLLLSDMVAGKCEHSADGELLPGHFLEPLPQPGGVIGGLRQGSGVLAPRPDDPAAVENDFVVLKAGSRATFSPRLGLYNPNAPRADSDVVEVELACGAGALDVMEDVPAVGLQGIEDLGDVALADKTKVVVGTALKPLQEPADAEQEGENKRDD
jgi:hypothetical protein